MHKQIRPVSPPRQQPTLASCTRVQSCTLAGLEVSTQCTLTRHKHGQTGRRNSRRRSGCAKSFRSRTRCSKSRRSALTHLSCRRCSRPRRTTRGIRRARLRARSPVPCHSVSGLGRSRLSIRSDCWETRSSLATPDKRALVAVGCAEGVWIGYRHDSRCEYFVP